MADFLLQILFQTHAQCSLNNPITHNKVEIKKFKIPQSKEELEALSQKSFNKFTEKPHLRGSVHLNPAFWTSLVVETIKETLKNDSNALTANIPNGCCTKKDCSITDFYQIVVEEGQSEEKVESIPK